VWVEVDVETDLGGQASSSGLHLVEVTRGIGAGVERTPVPAQLELPEALDRKQGRLWWMMPAGPAGSREFRFASANVKASPVWRIGHDHQRRRIELSEGNQPVLCYNHGAVAVREGTHPHFKPGESYERGDYISPLYGPDGQELTEDYPRDHPHHRGVWWSWPVTRWKDQLADIWAVAGVWSQPVALRRVESGPVFAVIEAQNVWVFGKQKTPIVREEVVIYAFRQTARSRLVDVEIRLTALADDVAIGGRPKAGYGGFALRAAPCDDRQITLHTDPGGTAPRRSWLDYSGVFPGSKGPAGVAIFEHVSNPDYPNPLHQYPQCNCVMPAYPEKREVILSKDQPLVLKHRLWIHAGGPDEEALAAVWASYAEPPKVALTR
jgi:hypothetical protein